MQARFVIEGDDGKKLIPVGTVTEHPDCYMLVQMGVCEPVDDECRQRADRKKVAFRRFWPSITLGMLTRPSWTPVREGFCMAGGWMDDHTGRLVDG